MPTIQQQTLNQLRTFHAELSAQPEYAFNLPPLVQLEALIVQIVQYLKLTDKNPLTMDSFKSFIGAESLLSFESFCRESFMRQEKAQRDAKHVDAYFAKITKGRSKYVRPSQNVWTISGGYPSLGKKNKGRMVFPPPFMPMPLLFFAQLLQICLVCVKPPKYNID